MSHCLSESEIAVHSLGVSISYLKLFPNVFPLAKDANAANFIHDRQPGDDDFLVQLGDGILLGVRGTSNKWVMF